MRDGDGAKQLTVIILEQSQGLMAPNGYIDDMTGHDRCLVDYEQREQHRGRSSRKDLGLAAQHGERIEEVTFPFHFRRPFALVAWQPDGHLVHYRQW